MQGGKDLISLMPYYALCGFELKIISVENPVLTALTNHFHLNLIVQVVVKSFDQRLFKKKQPPMQLKRKKEESWFCFLC